MFELRLWIDGKKILRLTLTATGEIDSFIFLYVVFRGVPKGPKSALRGCKTKYFLENYLK